MAVGVMLVLAGLAGTLANMQLALVIRDQRTTPPFLLTRTSRRMRGSPPALLALRLAIGVITVGMAAVGVAAIVHFA